ncbi:MAG: M20 family metallopeptidase [Deltaproteobacteria bacterium]|nr:M20 family metallopeptidase [Deltaproteobacteria bacterium]
MTETRLAEKIAAAVDERRDAMFSLLEDMVNRDSGSNDSDDVNRLGDHLASCIAAMGGKTERFARDGGAITLSGTWLPPGAARDARRVLLVGHRDTVFPAGTAAARPFRRDETRAYGPGVADMKGGIVAGLFAIQALRAIEDIAGPIPVEILLTSDEETGSAVSGPVIAERCKTAKTAFFLEPARANGAVVTGRDGGDLLRIDVHGKAAHAGNSFADGVSAVTGLAAVIADFATLSNDKEGYSVNVGLIGGGSGAIIVADHAWGEVYTRFSTMEQRAYLLDAMHGIVLGYNRDGLRATLSEPVGFLPFVSNKENAALFSLVREAGGAFGLELEGVTTRGAADAGIATTSGVPTICGMGPVGGNLHTDEEFMVSESLPERAKVLALAVAMASKRFL